MTTGKKNTIGAIAAVIVVPIAMFLLATGAANRELAGKEDREAHATDRRALSDSIRMVGDSVREERRIRQLQAVRDSAQMATVLDRITDLSCDNNPRRTYCRGGR